MIGPFYKFYVFLAIPVPVITHFYGEALLFCRSVPCAGDGLEAAGVDYGQPGFVEEPLMAFQEKKKEKRK